MFEHGFALSPFVVPLGGMVFVLGIIAIREVSQYHKRRMQSDERMRAIEKGLPLPPLEEAEAFRETVARDPYWHIDKTRKSGIVVTAIGIGTMLLGLVLCWTQQDRDAVVIAGAGLIPLCIGLGLLVDYALQLRDLKSRKPAG